MSTVHNFCQEANCTDGAAPLGGLVQDEKGNIYGTTTLGGANQQGTIFGLMDDSKVFKTLYSFCSLPGCPDGQNPSGALIEVEPGVFYGTTSTGGVSGMGTVYSFSAP
jgi:hypothetical protein